ncbi:MAG: hypothetical protein GY851_26415 [bacterium]|nr:hypothetical protein [bacterium]
MNSLLANRVLPLMALCALVSCAKVEVPEMGPRDAYGGELAGQFEPGERFRIEQDGPRWWFVTPEGGRFLSVGVNHITCNGDAIKGSDERPYVDALLAKYGTKDKWAEEITTRFEGWGFNTIGAWSSAEVNPHLPRTPILNLGGGYWGQAWKEAKAPDFFAPAFTEYVAERAKSIEAHAGDPLVIGYFIDNEQPWSTDHRKAPTIFAGYVAMPEDAPGKQRLLEFFKERHGTVESFNKAWKADCSDWASLLEVTELEPRNGKLAKADREAFTLLVARKYFETTSNAIREKDPGALVLGSRLIPFSVPKVVVQACGEFCDVVSVNYYKRTMLGATYINFAWRGAADVDLIDLDESLKAFYDASQRPVMVTEWTSRIKKKGYNDYPPSYAIQPVVRNEKKRAKRFDHCMMEWFSQPWFVGAHWFKHADQPMQGRGDGENCTFGLVDIEDEPYHEFVEGVTKTIPKAWKAHSEAE